MSPFDFDDPNPADDAVVSGFPANERASRLAITQAFEIEHDEATGHHKITEGSTAARDAITDWKKGSLWFNTGSTPAKLERQKNPSSPFAWEEIGAAPDIPSGTKMVFDQDAAPTGWTRDTTVNDKVIRLVSGARADGGTWTVGGLTFAGNAFPTHAHEIPFGTGTGGDIARLTLFGTGAARTRTFRSGGVGDSGTTGAFETEPLSVGTPSGTVSQDGTWRPLHRDMIVATRD